LREKRSFSSEENGSPKGKMVYLKKEDVLKELFLK